MHKVFVTKKSTQRSQLIQNFLVYKLMTI